MINQIDKVLEDNFFKKVTFLPSLCNEMELIQGNAIHFVESSVNSDTFNVACLRNKNALSQEELNYMISYYNGRPFALWVGPENFDDRVDNILQASGLVCTEKELGMAIDSEKLIIKLNEISEFTAEEVNDSIKMQHYGNVMASVFEPFDDEAVAFYKRDFGNYLKNNSSYKMFVGYIADEPVTICCAVIDEDFGGIYDIVTNPKFQRKGLGTYMTSLASKYLIQNGCSIIGMQASDDGQYVYTKMGFESFGTFRVYSIGA